MENSVASSQQCAVTLQQQATQWGEPFEVSTLRPEDFAKIRDVSGAAEILSSNNAPSSITARGHQYPTAFLLKASGLFDQGVTAPIPLAYTHLDIAGSATEGDPLYGKPTASPLVGLYQYLINR